MYKLIAIDLDETLFCDDKSVCKKNKDAITKALEKGKKIVICTGRGPCMINDLFDVLDIRKQDQFSIFTNGGYICSNSGNSILFENIIRQDLATKVYEFSRKYNIGIQVFTPEKTHFLFNDETENNFVRTINNSIIVENDEDYFYTIDTPILKYILLVRDEKTRYHYRDMLEKDFPELEISFSSGRYIEVNMKGITKGTGLLKLCEALDIDISETIGIGDNSNDVELIKTAGLGVCMCNGLDEVKAISDVITTLDNNEGGVGEIIEKYML